MLCKCFALEGLECSGKTTLFNCLQEKYTNMNVAFIPEAAAHFFNNYETNINGNSIVEIGFMTYNSIAFNKAYQCLNKGYNLIFDRSWLCQSVYSNARRLLNADYEFNTKYIEYQENIFKEYFQDVFKNTIIIYLDLSIDMILERKSNSLDRHPDQQKFDKEWLKLVDRLYQDKLKKAQEDGMIVEIIKTNKLQEEVVSEFDQIFRKYVLNIKQTKSKSIKILENKEIL